MFALVNDSGIDFIGQNRDVPLNRNFGDGFEIGLRQESTGRVLRRIDDNQLGFGSSPWRSSPSRQTGIDTFPRGGAEQAYPPTKLIIDS